MANWKEIKRRIKSIQNTSKITKAMELISTVKMKKAQDASSSKKEYIRGLMEVLWNLSESFADTQFFKKCEKDVDWKIIWKTLWVIVSSNKWLCWWYNINVLKKVNQFIKDKDIQGWEMDFVALWKRWAQFIARTWNNLVFDFSEDFTDNVNFKTWKQISRELQKKFLSWEYSKIILFYNHYVNTIKQIAISRKFLPITKNSIESYFKDIFWDEYSEKIWNKDLENNSQKISHNVEPSVDEFLENVLPMFLDAKFFDVLLWAKASEHSSRMIAMKNATDNAKKFAWELTLKYNKARQSAITTEIWEIVSWVESTKDI